MTTPGTRRTDTVELASGYAKSHRLYEIGGMVVAIVLDGVLAYRLAVSPFLSGWLVPLALFMGMVTADFISGFLHWTFDSWGSTTTPIVGQLAIRTFREHHVDQKSITRHDYIETNGHNYAVSIPFSVTGIYLASAQFGAWGTFIAMYMLSCAFGGAMTSQSHKWAHMDSPPTYVRWLQRAHLLITPEHHAKHHTPPYDRNYCIIVGWLNGPLRAIRFFETLERIITAVTGAIPREDDIGKENAIAVLEEAEAPADCTPPGTIPVPVPVTVPARVSVKD